MAATGWPGPGEIRGRPLAIAHRGAGAAERYGRQDLDALRRGGVDAVEFDVNTTRDGALVAHHGGPVASVLTALGRPVPVGARAARSSSTVVEVLDGLAATGLLGYADVKHLTWAGATALARLLQERDLSRRVLLASGSRRILQLCASAAPAVSRSVLFRSPFTDPVAAARRSGASYVHPCWEWRRAPELRLADDRWRRVEAAGLGLVTWHEEDPSALRALSRARVTGICSDEPLLLAAVLRERDAGR